ncbi:MAG TPA: alpha-amylase family protein [Spirillospora sp.]|nr:alpha-amylase family protein [Spirillospora sp.]
MLTSEQIAKEAQVSLRRLLPRLDSVRLKKKEREVFIRRLEKHFPRAFGLLYGLYGERYDFFYHLQRIFDAAVQAYKVRPAALKKLDAQREADPLWFQDGRMIGGVCYVDLFAGNLQALREKIPYFEELGLTYLHLMPLFKAPEGKSDGGYAVSSYREVNPALGTMDELAQLAAELRARGISLVLDFVFNHTSDQHTWALRALAGAEEYQNFYLLFDDRTLPDLYERTLREIFPDQAPGSFTYNATLKKWVWTTFNNFQWDLNYANSAVFTAMMEEMLFLANQGVEVLRLDAVAFIWKQLGTTCENLPQAHQIIQALNALVRVAAPAVVFKSEAIVHPDFVASYINSSECPISYNPTLMALLWEALATREVRLLRHSMSKRFEIAPDCAWVNYVRVHDDIGWSFADEDAAEIGINGFDHRQFLNQFYTGRFPGSFATGLPFNFNPITMDMRISGTCASLAGLEQALRLGNETYIENAIRRILLIHGIILSAGGIPLIYLGDEIATLNDYSYQHDPAKADDSRWVHRPQFDWTRAENRHDPATIEGRVFQPLQRMIEVRKSNPVFAGSRTLFFDTANPHVLGYIHNRQLLVLANFSDFEQVVRRDVLAVYWPAAGSAVDLISGESLADGDVRLRPYQFVWLLPEGAAVNG